jgi:hypothetical protein
MRKICRPPQVLCSTDDQNILDGGGGLRLYLFHILSKSQFLKRVCGSKICRKIGKGIMKCVAVVNVRREVRESRRHNNTCSTGEAASSFQRSVNTNS